MSGLCARMFPRTRRFRTFESGKCGAPRRPLGAPALPRTAPTPATAARQPLLRGRAAGAFRLSYTDGHVNPTAFPPSFRQGPNDNLTKQPSRAPARSMPFAGAGLGGATMRLSLRFIVPLLIALAAFAYAAVPLADALMERWFVRDLDIRSSSISAAVQDPVTQLIAAGSDAKITQFFNRM